MGPSFLSKPVISLASLPIETLRGEMGRRARECAKGFSRDKIAREYASSLVRVDRRVFGMDKM